MPKDIGGPSLKDKREWADRVIDRRVSIPQAEVDRNLAANKTGKGSNNHGHNFKWEEELGMVKPALEAGNESTDIRLSPEFLARHQMTQPQTHQAGNHIVKSGGGYKLLSKSSGRTLGTHSSLAGAKAQEAAINISKARAAGHRVPRS